MGPQLAKMFTSDPSYALSTGSRLLPVTSYKTLVQVLKAAKGMATPYHSASDAENRSGISAAGWHVPTLVWVWLYIDIGFWCASVQCSAKLVTCILCTCASWTPYLCLKRSPRFERIGLEITAFHEWLRVETDGFEEKLFHHFI